MEIFKTQKKRTHVLHVGANNARSGWNRGSLSTLAKPMAPFRCLTCFFWGGGRRISEAISSHQKYLSHPQALAGITETGKKGGGVFACFIVLGGIFCQKRGWLHQQGGENSLDPHLPSQAPLPSQPPAHLVFFKYSA